MCNALLSKTLIQCLTEIGHIRTTGYGRFIRSNTMSPTYIIPSLRSFAFLLAISVSAVAQQSIPPPGKLVDIGGYRLHLNCTGKGDPTVVLIPGGGDFSFDWGLVQPNASRFTRVCSYDFAGSAWSVKHRRRLDR